MAKFDFTNSLEAQDMLKLIVKDKDFSLDEAVRFSINQNIYRRIIKTGWGSIALPIWGHDDPERIWEVLDNPQIEVEIEEDKLSLVKKVAEEEDIDFETAVAYFLLFTMETLGYHI